MNKKVAIVAADMHDLYVEATYSHLASISEVTVVTDCNEADVVLVFVDLALVSDDLFVRQVEGMLPPVTGKRVVPILVRKCEWRRRMPLLANRKHPELEKWLTQYSDIDTAVMTEIVELMLRLTAEPEKPKGYQKSVGHEPNAYDWYNK